MATGIETERKFALVKGQSLPDLSSLAVLGPEEHVDLVSVYYDTLDYRLNAARQIIRRRSGGSEAGWQAKLPTENPDERVEVQLPPGGARMPRELRDLVSDTVGESALVPVAELRTHRVARRLLDPDGTVLAVLSVDQVVATVAGRTREWPEAEVELVYGPTSLLDDVERALAEAGVARSQSPSKLAQALSDRLPNGEAVAMATESGAVLGQYLALQVGVLQALEIEVLRDAEDAVHRTRVATRRLRSTLSTFSGTLRPAAVRALRDELRWYSELLGAARDAEVLQIRLRRVLSGLAPEVAKPVAEQAEAHLAGERAAAHEAVISAMFSDRYRRLMLSLERLLVDPPLDRMAGEPASYLLPRMMDDAVQRVRAATERADARPNDLTRWHRVRKAAKAARYAAEAMSVLPEGDANADVAVWTAVTSALGEVQDAVLAEQLIRELSWQTVSTGGARIGYDELRGAIDVELREALLRGKDALELALSR